VRLKKVKQGTNVLTNLIPTRKKYRLNLYNREGKPVDAREKKKNEINQKIAGRW